MTGLFARVYLDEDVSARVEALIAARGFDVLSTLAAGRLAEDDHSQLNFTAPENRVLVTHNRRDFERLAAEYFTTGTHHAGIIIAVRRLPRVLADRILGVLNQRTADELLNQTRYI
jgi:hypothetical protein